MMIPEEDPLEFLYKIIFVGDIGTGKTSIIKRYVHNTFHLGYKSTIGVDFALKLITRDDCTVRLQMWDIAGQERFGNMTRVYYNSAHVAVIVYDVCRTQTFEVVTKWLEDVRVKLGEDVPIIILANKCDLAPDYNIEALEQYCNDNNITAYASTSALKGEGIEEIMNKITDMLVEKDLKNKSPSNTNEHVFRLPNNNTSDVGFRCC